MTNKMNVDSLNGSEDSMMVSVILPTLNRAHILQKCIDSVLNQSYENFELIICDDCSTDNTEEIAQQYSTKNKMIKYIKNLSRMGLPGNRNIGIQNSEGEIIFFIEDDMVLDRECIKSLVRSLTEILAKQIQIGGITPALITNCDVGSNNIDLLNFSLKSAKNNDKPCVIDELTGIRHYNFSTLFSKLEEVPDMHACSMYFKKYIDFVGNYDDKNYKGNFLYEETDLNQRIKNLGLTYYFEPNAILVHNIVSGGGCRVKKMSYRYYFILNHLKFVRKNYGTRSLLMAPSFLLLMSFVGLKILYFNFSNTPQVIGN